MNKAFITFVCLFLSAFATGAQTPFDLVFEGCQLAASALSGNAGGTADVRKAADKIKEAKWSSLEIIDTSGNTIDKIGNHLVFTDSYLKDLADNHKVKKKAEEYYSETRSGDGVRLCTKVIKGKKTAKFSFNYVGGRKIRIGVVAETGGLVNLTVKTKEKGSNTEPKTTKENTDEYYGAPSRLLEIDLPQKKQYIITLEVTNKFKKDKSFAIIVN